MPHSSEAIEQVHTDEAADQRTKGLGAGKFVELQGPKTKVGDPRFSHAPGRPSDARGITIESRHRPSGTDNLSGEHRHIACTTADVQHAHSGPNPCRTEGSSQRLTEDRALTHQAMALTVAGAHSVVGGFVSGSRRFVRHIGPRTILEL